MIESWIQECSELAPYLKEKLAADKVHSWLTAPYIHRKVRDALAEHEPASTVYKYSHYPVFAGYSNHWTPGGGGGGCGGSFYGTTYEALTNQTPESQIASLQYQIQAQHQLNQIQLMLNTPLIDYKEFISRIY